MKRRLLFLSMTILTLSWLVVTPDYLAENVPLARYASYGDGTRDVSYETMVTKFNASELAEFHRYWAKISLQTCQPVRAELFGGLKEWERASYYESFVEKCVDDSGVLIGPLPREYDPADAAYEERLESKRGVRRSTDFSVATIVANFSEQELAEFFNYWAGVSIETCRPLGSEISDGLNVDERQQFQSEYDDSCVSESGGLLGPFTRTISAADAAYEARVMPSRF